MQAGRPGQNTHARNMACTYIRTGRGRREAASWRRSHGRTRAARAPIAACAGPCLSGSVCVRVCVCVCVCGKQWVKWSAGGLHSLGDVCKEPFFDCCCCCWLQFEEVRTRTQQKGAPKAKTARPISAQTRVDHPWINRIDRQGCWLGDWGVSNPQHDKWGRLDFEGRWGARQP